MKNLNRVIVSSLRYPCVIARRALARRSNLRYGSISMEFAILLGIVFMAFMAMNTYMKRGLQGRVRDMTDQLISNEQVVEVNTGYTTSNSTTGEGAVLGSQMFEGGGTRINLASNKQYGSSAIYDDNKEIVVSASPIPSEHGQTWHPDWENINETSGPPLVNNQDAVRNIQNSTNAANGVTNYSNSTVTSDAQSTQVLLPVINTAEYGPEDQFIEDQTRGGNIAALQAQRDSLTSMAAQISAQVSVVEDEGQYMMDNSHVNCHDNGRCEAAMRKLYADGYAMKYRTSAKIAVEGQWAQQRASDIDAAIARLNSGSHEILSNLLLEDIVAKRVFFVAKNQEYLNTAQEYRDAAVQKEIEADEKRQEAHEIDHDHNCRDAQGRKISCGWLAKQLKDQAQILDQQAQADRITAVQYDTRALGVQDAIDKLGT